MDLFLQKYDHLNNLQWTETWSSPGIRDDHQGRHFLYATGYTTPTANNWDIFVAKYDKDLNRVWYTTWGGPRDDNAFDIQFYDHSVYITGRINSFPPNEKNEAFIFRVEMN